MNNITEGNLPGLTTGEQCLMLPDSVAVVLHGTEEGWEPGGGQSPTVYVVLHISSVTISDTLSDTGAQLTVTSPVTAALASLTSSR